MDAHILIAFANPLDPLIGLLNSFLGAINNVVHNFGWSLVLLAAIVKLALWPLSDKQYRSMAEMQRIQPQLKALQARHKGDPQKLNAATMELYKEHKVNPFASCLPLVLQLPILISLYQAIIRDSAQFALSTWLYIGSPIAASVPYHLLAHNLHEPDYLLLALYVVSMYYSFKLNAPASDPAQAQQQKIMAFISPALIAYLGVRYAWPSALIIYWLSFNVFTMAQQIFLMRRYPKPVAETIVEATPVRIRTGKGRGNGNGNGGSSAKPSLTSGDSKGNAVATAGLPSVSSGKPSNGPKKPSNGSGNAAARRRRG